MKQGVSVIVCCYNSSSRLPDTLKHLSIQYLPEGVPWEVIVVDNASKDNTAEVATNEWKKHSNNGVTLRVVNEPIAGLSHAREKGVREANFEYIIFCDDDNWLQGCYLFNSFMIMEGNTSIGALGGKSSPSTDNGVFPSWFEEYKGMFAVGKQADVSGDISKIGTVWGAGLVTRKSLFLEAYIGKPSLMTDRKGNNLSSGGDGEYCSRLLLMGYTLYYDETLQFIHFIPKERLTEDYRKRLMSGFHGVHHVMVLYYKLVLCQTSTKFKKSILFVKALVKFVLTSLKIFKSSTKRDEAVMLYFLTGLKFRCLPSEAKHIYKYNRKWRITL